MTDRSADENGWLRSAKAWIERMPEAGDFAREFVLDRPMLERATRRSPKTMLDIGCGEGRFCRMLAGEGVQVTGIDPVRPFIDQARRRDPKGTYECAFAEGLPFADESFDLVSFYLSLIDIDDMPSAIAEATRVLRPGGTVLIANLTSFFTSNGTIERITGQDGKEYFPLGSYLEDRADWFEWDGLRIRNWHRPLSAYMTALIEQDLVLTHFDEPLPSGGPPAQVEKYRHTPFLMMMEWRKPGSGRG